MLGNLTVVPYGLITLPTGDKHPTRMQDGERQSLRTEAGRGTITLIKPNLRLEAKVLRWWPLY